MYLSGNSKPGPQTTTHSTGIDAFGSLRLFTRYEHGNRPVRVWNEGDTTHYAIVYDDGELLFSSARMLLKHLFGHETTMTFDRYFRIGKWRQRGRESGRGDIITLLTDGDPNARTSIKVLGALGNGRSTNIAVSERGLGDETFPRNLETPPTKPETFPTKPQSGVSFEVRGLKPSLETLKPSLETSKVPLGREALESDLDPVVQAFWREIEGDLPSVAEFIPATDELRALIDKAVTLELDRIEGKVGIDLAGPSSGRGDAKTRADEVRKLLWSGFAGKMLSQGYDPEDVLQEVYRGLLVRNRGTCPWDGRKSTFGHYVFMCVNCVLTNYHRKQVRRVDRNAVSLDAPTKLGEDPGDVGKYGSVKIWDGSDAGDRMALEGLMVFLSRLGDESVEASLGQRILPLVNAGHSRSEIARAVGEKPAVISRALTWLRRQTSRWAVAGDLGARVPDRYL